jgi:hypothetical protein
MDFELQLIGKSLFCPFYRSLTGHQSRPGHYRKFYLPCRKSNVDSWVVEPIS